MNIAVHIATERLGESVSLQENERLVSLSVHKKLRDWLILSVHKELRDWLILSVHKELRGSVSLLGRKEMRGWVILSMHKRTERLYEFACSQFN